MVRGKKMNLSEFLGDQTAQFIPEAALPSGPRVRAEGEEGGYGNRGGRGGPPGAGGPRGYDRAEPSRSEQSDQWRGDRGSSGFGSRGSDRFGDRSDRYGGDRREESDSSWRGGGGARDFGGPSRYDRPRGGFREPEERPSHMRLNLQPRSDGNTESSSPRHSRGDDRPSSRSDDKWDNVFSRGGGGSGFRRGNDRFDDRDRGYGSRYGSRQDDRGYGSRYDDRDRDFGRNDERSMSSGFNALRVQDDEDDKRPESQQQPTEEQAAQSPEKKLNPKQLRKLKAEEERKAQEEAKRKAAEEKKAAEEAAAKKADADRAVMKQILSSNKKGDDLVKVAKDAFKKSGGHPSAFVVFECVTAAAEDVAKSSANWIAPKQYGAFLKFAMEGLEAKEQAQGLHALQVFLNKHDFPKGVIHKCFMALYSLDVMDEAAFLDYKYDVDTDLPGRMKAIVQLTEWLTWLETPEESDDDEDDE